jgi:hypothetical protein
VNKWRKFGKKQLGTGRLGKAGKYRLRLLPDLTRAAPAARGGAGEGKDKASSKADDEAGSKAGNKAEQQAPGGLTKHVVRLESESADGPAEGGPAQVRYNGARARCHLERSGSARASAASAAAAAAAATAAAVSKCGHCARRFKSKHALRIHLTRNVKCRREVCCCSCDTFLLSAGVVTGDPVRVCCLVCSRYHIIFKCSLDEMR